MTTETSTFSINALCLPDLEKAVEKLNRKAAKLGTSPITVREIKREIIREKRNEGTYLEHTVVLDVAVISVEGETPVLNGWRFIAALEHTDAGNVVRVIPGNVLPDEFRETDYDRCDHCHVRRFRRATYIVHNQETGEYKQVGSSCLEDFVGMDPGSAAKAAQLLIQAGIEAQQASEINPDPAQHRDGYTIDPDEYMAHVARSIRQFGWVSRTEAHNGGRRATADMAFSDLITGPVFAGSDHDHAVENWTPTREDHDLARRALAFARTLNAEEKQNDYMYNIATIAALTGWCWKDLGFGASIIRAYQRRMEREAENAPRPESDHVGTVGEKININATLQFSRTFNGNYGVTTLYRFRDDAGNILTWFSSRSLDLDDGAEYQIAGRVKKHDDYKGTKQTVLTRCKITSA